MDGEVARVGRWCGDSSRPALRFIKEMIEPACWRLQIVDAESVPTRSGGLPEAAEMRRLI
jgi:hypothetical protein